MKKPLTRCDWEPLWKLRRAGFALDLLPHSNPQLELEVYPGTDGVMFASTDNFSWVQLSVALRAFSLVSIVAAYLFVDLPAREYHSIPRDRIPPEAHRIFSRPLSKTLRFNVGEGCVLHLPPRLHLPGCLLLGGEHPLPVLLPGQALPAELWVCDREGRYYGTGFSWQGGTDLCVLTSKQAIRERVDQGEIASRG